MTRRSNSAHSMPLPSLPPCSDSWQLLRLCFPTPQGDAIHFCLQFMAEPFTFLLWQARPFGEGYLWEAFREDLGIGLEDTAQFCAEPALWQVFRAAIPTGYLDRLAEAQDDDWGLLLLLNRYPPLQFWSDLGAERWHWLIQCASYLQWPRDQAQWQALGTGKTAFNRLVLASLPAALTPSGIEPQPDFSPKQLAQFKAFWRRNPEAGA